MKKKKWVLDSRGALLGLALALGLGLSACTEKPFVGIDITGAEYARGFDLTDHNGKRRTLADFKGQVVAVFFGFTQCPDVCPTTMTEMAEVKRQLGEDGKRFQALFVSIDPERDTPEIMREYMASFDPDFLALYADTGALAALAEHFKIYYKKVDGQTASSYTMDHSAGSYVFDTQGRVRLYNRYGTPVEGLLGDVQRLLKEG